MKMNSKVEQLRAELARAEAEAIESGEMEIPFAIKMGNKQNVVFSSTKGLKQRFPVTLYAPGWLFLLDHADEIRAFIEENKDVLSWER